MHGSTARDATKVEPKPTVNSPTGKTLWPAGCPPNGSSEYAHLYLIEGDAGGASHETCIDWYGTVKKNYSPQECMYYSGEEAVEHPGGEYGYPRAWNGGSVKHYVAATEYGNK